MRSSIRLRRAAKRLKSARRRLVNFERNVRSLTGRKQLAPDESTALLAASRPLIGDLQMVIDGL